MKVEWSLIIDTDQYAGNFERDMCAYCTGIIGECEVGEEEAEKFKTEYGEEFIEEMEEIIAKKGDEHGCYRPTRIHPTPGYFNDGMGKTYKENEWEEGMSKFPSYQSVAIFFHDKPTKEIIEMVKKRAEEFSKGMPERFSSNKQRTMKILGFRLKKKY